MADWRRFYGGPFTDVVTHRNGWTWAEGIACFFELLRNPEAAVAREANGGSVPWRVADYLLADTWGALTGKPHPGTPKVSRQAISDPKRAAAKARALDRKRDREQRIARGELQ